VRIVEQLGDDRHQRARVMAALRPFGPDAAAAVVAWAREVPHRRALLAEALGQIGSAWGLPTLLEWAADGDPVVRAAALAAVAQGGVDDRADYFALRALSDPDERTRAMAALALGRSRRPEAAPYLAAHLADAWLVAGHSARALKHMGEDGLRYLVACAKQDAPGADLARQMLWELQA
jgi:HEAT repeat protein